MDSGTISGIVTVVFILVFIGIVWWAYSKGNKQRFEDAGKLPFGEDDAPTKQGDKQ
ncbi:MAG: cbb3-type cytochrome C oxidase subunit 3 [Thiobacillus sp. 65-1059]|nr:cbb3-type cytochrome c oxidase subunit 3 [Thiobacillus sp.]OJW45441.1 MAG: cbb3-type cytochrome C oxidase subunit 3 [Thiobacillus sp. 65-1059]